MTTSEAILDTCCLINLAAAGDLVQLLPASGFVWYLPASVEAQGLQIRKSSDPRDSSRQTIDLDAVVRAGVLRRCDVEVTARELFLQIAAEHGDDADAAALTIAISRNCQLATDDRRLARLAKRRGVNVLTTVHVLKNAIAVIGNVPTEIAEMLKRIEQLGRWKPRETDPDAIWWKQHRGNG